MTLSGRRCIVRSQTFRDLWTYTFFLYKNQIISAQARCSYSKMAKISNFSQTLPLFMRLKCFSERAVSFTTSQWFVTSLVLELALPIDLNPRLTVLIKFVLIKEKKCMWEPGFVAEEMETLKLIGRYEKRKPQSNSPVNQGPVKFCCRVTAYALCVILGQN